MKNSDYWKERFVELEKASNSYGFETYKKIEPAFEKAQREIQNKIDVWLTRVADNNGVSIIEAKKMLDKNELKEFKWDIKDYIKYGEENAINEQWVKQLENASAKAHITRLEAMKIHLQQYNEVAFGNELDELDKMARKVYTENYYHSAYEISKGLRVAFNVGAIDENKLNNIITKPWASDGKNFSSRIWIQKTQMVNELHKELVRTCIVGEPPDKAIKHLTQFVDKKFKNAKTHAGRLIMTEQAYFHSVAQKDCFNDLDVEEFEIVATLDSHTSDVCREMDGNHFAMADYQSGTTAPPFHVYCRSVTCPYFNDEFSKDDMRIARDKDGNAYYVPADMKYGEWKKKFVGSSLDTPVKSNDIKYTELVDDIKKRNNSGLVLDYNPVEMNLTTLTEDEIIKALAGGDMTDGSCASVALAYIGQKQGWNVLDFRGGESRVFFSELDNLFKMSQMDGIIALRYGDVAGKSSCTLANNFLKQCEVGKEYYLCAGEHASIVRAIMSPVIDIDTREIIREEVKYQYLELQSATESGWTYFDRNARYTLTDRFGCCSSSGDGERWNFMINITDSNFSTDEFKSLLGYINTAKGKQVKGIYGAIK